MRRLLLFLALALFVNCYPHYPAHAQGYGNPPGYYPPGAPPPPPPHAGRQGPYAPGPENCGTPDEPKACPPMPRVPLPYYPANRP
jgi:hypothetical protein